MLAAGGVSLLHFVTKWSHNSNSRRSFTPTFCYVVAQFKQYYIRKPLTVNRIVSQKLKYKKDEQDEELVTWLKRQRRS